MASVSRKEANLFLSKSWTMLVEKKSSARATWFFDDLDSIDVFLTRFLNDSSFATRMTWNFSNLSCRISQKIFKQLEQSSKSYGRGKFLHPWGARRPGWLRPTNVLHVGNMKTIYICLSNARSMPKPDRPMLVNVLHGVLVYSPEAKWLGQRTKEFTGTTPWNVLCSYLWSSLYRCRPLQTNCSHFGLLRRLSGQLLMSGRRFSPDVTKALRELRFMPFCIAWPFEGWSYSIYRLHEFLGWI